jgi:hypothetical protein
MKNVLHRLKIALTQNALTKLLLRNVYFRTAAWSIGLLLLIAVSSFAYAYQSTPAAIRNPQFEHLHFRMQIIVGDKSVNFADKKFQEGYSKDNCNADITLSPVHFHDGKDQFVHVHWRNLTGGEVLKLYGWNYIGGVDGMLGYRFDAFPHLKTVQIHGMNLPSLPSGTKLYVYSGDEQHYSERNFEDFKKLSLEKFFSKSSNVHVEDTSWLNTIFPKAYAHAGHEHDSVTAAGTSNEAELQRINNLLGNVVIFAQNSKPSDAQIKQRFAHLEPLSDSTCGG